MFIIQFYKKLLIQIILIAIFFIINYRRNSEIHNIFNTSFCGGIKFPESIYTLTEVNCLQDDDILEQYCESWYSPLSCYSQIKILLIKQD